MKRILLSGISAAAIAFSMQAQTAPRFIYGLSWGYSAAFYETHTRVYRTSTHFAVTDNGQGWEFQSLGDVSAHAGFALGGHSELCLEAGYCGISVGTGAISTPLRWAYLFSGQLHDGWMFELKAGPAWKLGGKGANPAVLALVGTGYRVHLGGKCCLDFKLGFKGTYDRPILKDSQTGEEIKEALTLQSKSFRGSLRAGLSLSF